MAGTGPVNRRSGALANSGKHSRPNFLLIVSDEHRTDTCGCYGTPVRMRSGNSPTPHIDELARRGIRFTSMYCPSPLCAPSRAAYMTGCYPHTTTALHHQMHGREAGETRFPGVRPGLPGMGECFREIGYRTAAIGKVHVHGEMADGWDLGFDVRKLRFYTEFPGNDYKELKGGDLKRRYREMAPYSEQFYRNIDPPRFSHAPAGLKVKDNPCNEHFLETLIQKDEEMADPMVVSESIAFMRECHEAGQPFFLHVGLEKPHRPWTVPQMYLDRFDPKAMPLPETVASWVQQGEMPLVQRWCHSALKGDEARRSIAAYYACVSAVDDCVGRLVGNCEDFGIRDNTVIIYTSDHGESLFQHGLIEKHNMLEGPVSVPFVFSYSSQFPQGTTVDDPASLIDLLPTLAEMGRAQPPTSCEGASLLPALSGNPLSKRLVFSEFYQRGNNCWPDKYTPVRMALDENFKYIYTHAALDQLYARDQADPDETRNLALESGYAERVSRMKLVALHDWELDEYPQLSISGCTENGSVHLDWEPWPDAAGYDLYRSAYADPLKSRLIARGHQTNSFTDIDALEGSTCSYWVLAHPRLTQPHVDRRGLSRYGQLPVKADKHPMKLPVTVRLDVHGSEGFSVKPSYKPLLGLKAFDRDWFFSGYVPQTGPDVIHGRGPCLLLLAVDPCRNASLAAGLRTLSRGPTEDDTLSLVLNYDTMDSYHRILVGRGGDLILQKRDGKRFQELARATKAVSALSGQLVQVVIRGNRITAFLDGVPALEYDSLDSLPEGRFGLEAGLAVAGYEIRQLEISAG